MRMGRRGFLAGVAGGTTLATAGTIGAAAATRDRGRGQRRGGSRGGDATFTWLGTAGWRVDIGERTVLVDPFLSRYSTGLFDGTFDERTPLTVDQAAVDAHVGSPETVLVTHSHWDHLNDVPYIAASTGARVFGTLTTHHLARALGVPSAQLGPVQGGEVLEFGDYTVEVVSSLHSRNANNSIAFPGVHALPLSSPPTVVADLTEGNTLTFQLNVKDGPSVFFMGASDFVARNLAGLSPDVAMIAVPSSGSTHDYARRLVEALDEPPTVVPVHWDHFERELSNPPVPDPVTRDRLDALVAAIRETAPGTRVLLPEYLTPYTF
ncbi:MBL fold metallo-hydrolase [Streptomyces hoynatensis]|uniref:MBL fold metallo-hydrolase n=2 Tax=Streptomyces hoynatensis TaxID=1141874 RepID=A0A3A9ZEQ8_9ACTN|nr:MBL fold metallo-hydrolase [Streptomyces hoynatensis]